MVKQISSNKSTTVAIAKGSNSGKPPKVTVGSYAVTAVIVTFSTLSVFVTLHSPKNLWSLIDSVFVKDKKNRNRQSKIAKNPVYF